MAARLRFRRFAKDSPHQNTGGDRVDDRGDVRSLRAERAHSFELASCWGEIKLVGRHGFDESDKLTFDTLHLRIPSDNHPSGVLNFATNPAQGPTGGGSRFASYLLGDVASFARNVESVYDASEMQSRFFFYGQDTWRVTSKLTVNHGLRWEIYRPEYFAGPGKGANINPNTGEVLVAGASGVGNDLNVSIPPRAFAPRLGIAYQINDKTVIRTGYCRASIKGSLERSSVIT